ncbi:MAG: efflux RND transporter periplasmic adaptor subunit, partial [Rhodospirillaceae bacterium]|nr:efflux RND transporter periplasmic adaptor subunit [Rhodospirillaceae bacterium]
SKFDATVLEVVATKGSAVNKGDILVRFDAEGRDERVSEARARLAQTEIAFDAATALGKEGFRSKLNTAGAKADMEAARAGLALAKSNFANTQIRAPFSGIVDDIPVEAGDLVSKGKMAARVIDLSQVKVSAEVAERDAVNVSLGGSATVKLMDGRSFEGMVSYVSKASSAATRTYVVEVTLQTPDHSIADGVTAELRLPMQTENAHRVSPAILTLNDEGRLGIKAVDSDNLVVFHGVEMVSDTRDGIWISGLGPEINVIVVGQEFVRPGQKVEP